MTRTVDPDLTEWSVQLNTLTPQGLLPARGTPRARMADFITEQLAPRLVVRPTAYATFDLFNETQIDLLLMEAISARRGARDYMGRHVIAAPDSTRQIIDESGVRDRLAAEHGVSIRSDNEALFLYYSRANWCPMHLDDQLEYEFNLLTMLRRIKVGSTSRTATYFWLPDGQFMAKDLHVGQSVFFHASFTPHGRPPVPPEEEVVMLAVGMGRPGAIDA